MISHFFTAPCLRSRQRDSDGPFGPFPSPSLSPVGSSLLGREPTSMSFAIFRCRVFRVPSAAEPLLTVPLFQRGMSAPADRGILVGPAGRIHHHLSARWAALFWEESLLQWQFHVVCAESLGLHLRRSRGTVLALRARPAFLKANS